QDEQRGSSRPLHAASSSLCTSEALEDPAGRAGVERLWPGRFTSQNGNVVDRSAGETAPVPTRLSEPWGPEHDDVAIRTGNTSWRLEFGPKMVRGLRAGVSRGRSRVRGRLR